MTLSPLDAEFAEHLGSTKDAIASDCVVQFGARGIPFADAPPWPELEGLTDEALIESYLVSDDGVLTPLSDAPELDAWSERADAFVAAILAACREHAIAIDFPAYVTASITPTAMLEGNPHLDDDQFVPGAGLGLVAINGQHLGPRVAADPIALERPATHGPLAIPEVTVAGFGNLDLPVASSGEIAVLAQFGQLHAGPSHNDLAGCSVDASHRQLLVFRAATPVRD